MHEKVSKDLCFKSISGSKNVRTQEKTLRTRNEEKCNTSPNSTKTRTKVLNWKPKKLLDLSQYDMIMT